MTRRVESGHYDVGRVDNDDRYSRCGNGEYGVIRGGVANDDGHEEWQGIIGLSRSSWFSYKIFDSGSGMDICPTTHLLEECSSKSECVDNLKDRCDFDEEY
jgi:hypothetical protein